MIFEHLLVLAHMTEQLEVEQDDEEHGQGVRITKDCNVEAPCGLILGQEVKRASGQVALWKCIVSVINVETRKGVIINILYINNELG